MKKVVLLITFLFCYQNSASQEMNIAKLDAILTKVSDSLVSTTSQWRFTIKQIPFICIADTTHNRMRIVSPITDGNRLTEKLKTASLIANFHTALDVKYAISEDILWAVFIHPLKELTEGQVLDAISQVYYANLHFGTTFASTSLVFPGRKPTKKVEKEKQNTIQRF